MKYSELRSAKRIPLAEAVPLPHPFTLFIEPTNICNFKCTYCPESFDDFYERSGGKFRLSLADFDIIASQVEEFGHPVKVINFYMMGEPLTNRDTPRFIREARIRGIAERLILTTNASLLDENAAQQLLNGPGLDYLRVSIYGSDQEHFTSVTGNTMALSRIRDNVARFRSMRNARGLKAPFVYVKMIDPGDPAQAQAFRDMFEGTADEVYIEPVMNWNDDFDGSLAGKPKDALLETDYFAQKKKCCPSPFYILIIHSDLNVTVCCVDWNKQLLVGNLRKQTLREIWEAEPLLSIQLAHLNGERERLLGCKTCTFLHTFPDTLDDLSAKTFLERRAHHLSTSR